MLRRCKILFICIVFLPAQFFRERSHGMELKVSSLASFPVKSGAAVYLSKTEVGPAGLFGDHRYMLVDGLTGNALTQRENPKLALITPNQGPVGWFLSYPGIEDGVYLPFQPDGDLKKETKVKLHNADFPAYMQPAPYNEWFGRCLGTLQAPMLVGIPDEHLRKKQKAEGVAASIACHDSSPISIVSEESIGAVKQFLSFNEESCFAKRFRSNIVISGAGIFTEEHWKRILIGTTEFAIRKRIPRCGMLDVDPLTGVYNTSVPILRAVGTHRNGKIGVYAYVEKPGIIKIGDTVTVLE